MTSSPTHSKDLRGIDFLAVFLASVFFLSYLPAKLVISLQLKFKRKTLEERKWTGAGLIGSIAGALTYLLLPFDTDQSFIAMAIGTIFAVIVSDRAEKALGSHDDSRIVIDEWIGAWIALWSWPQAFTVWPIMSFVLFRVFDVHKGPIGHRLQKLPGGWGVVMDDVGAGITANVATHIIFYLSHTFLH